jgi:hypothetical protein
MTFATISDVSTRLGRPITDPNEVAQVEAWLEDIEAIILNRLPDLPARVATGSPSVAVVAAVESNAVIRKIKNPDGKVSEGVDDYNYRLNENARKGELFLTDDEWDLLTPGSPDGAWTIVPGGSRRIRGEWLHPDVWVPLP